MNSDPLGESYLKLALAIDQHRPGYVDSYFGPIEFKIEAGRRGPRPLPELTQIAEELATTIHDAPGLDGQRRSYLATEVQAMQTTLRLLRGEPLDLSEEVAGVYDIRPAWVEEDSLKEARQELDDLLPAGETLNERMIARLRTLEVPRERLPALSQYILSELRDRAHQLFTLPEGEALTLETPQVDEPWGAYHTYQGNFQSQVQINAHYSLQVLELISMLAHETYPGHHTEAAIKEARLMRGLTRLEHALILSNAPSCVIQEGIAMQAIHVLMDRNELAEWCETEIFPRAGLSGLDAHQELQINQARWKLEEAFGNIAFMLHDEGADREEAIAYINRNVPEKPGNVAAMIDFIQTPSLRAYVFSYTHGYWLLERLFENQGKPHHYFSRLLSEPLTPSLVREWID